MNNRHQRGGLLHLQPPLRKRPIEVDEVYATMPKTTEPTVRTRTAEEISASSRRSLAARMRADLLGTIVTSIGGVVLVLIIVLLCRRLPPLATFRRNTRQLETPPRSPRAPIRLVPVRPSNARMTPTPSTLTVRRRKGSVQGTPGSGVAAGGSVKGVGNPATQARPDRSRSANHARGTPSPPAVLPPPRATGARALPASGPGQAVPSVLQVELSAHRSELASHAAFAAGLLCTSSAAVSRDLAARRQMTRRASTLAAVALRPPATAAPAPASLQEAGKQPVSTASKAVHTPDVCVIKAPAPDESEATAKGPEALKVSAEAGACGVAAAASILVCVSSTEALREHERRLAVIPSCVISIAAAVSGQAAVRAAGIRAESRRQMTVRREAALASAAAASLAVASLSAEPRSTKTTLTEVDLCRLCPHCRVYVVQSSVTASLAASLAAVLVGVPPRKRIVNHERKPSQMSFESGGSATSEGGSGSGSTKKKTSRPSSRSTPPDGNVREAVTFLYTGTGAITVLKMDWSVTTVWEVKELLHKSGWVPPALQQLECEGRVMADENEVCGHYGVGRGVAVLLTAIPNSESSLPLCPSDKTCAHVMETDHLAAYKHTCRLPVCHLVHTDALHAVLFVHTEQQIINPQGGPTAGVRTGNGAVPVADCPWRQQRPISHHEQRVHGHSYPSPPPIPGEEYQGHHHQPPPYYQRPYPGSPFMGEYAEFSHHHYHHQLHPLSRARPVSPVQPFVSSPWDRTQHTGLPSSPMAPPHERGSSLAAAPAATTALLRQAHQRLQHHHWSHSTQQHARPLFPSAEPKPKSKQKPKPKPKSSKPKSSQQGTPKRDQEKDDAQRPMPISSPAQHPASPPCTPADGLDECEVMRWSRPGSPGMTWADITDDIDVTEPPGPYTNCS
eukprot:Hpha_TRINITY_DN15392_c1_g1::TRINITY_DN15392_c1_g1_i1::g.90537::m.90537